MRFFLCEDLVLLLLSLKNDSVLQRLQEKCQKNENGKDLTWRLMHHDCITYSVST